MAQEILRSMVLLALLVTVFYIFGMIAVEYSRWRVRRMKLRTTPPQPHAQAPRTRASARVKIDFEDPALVRGYDSPEVRRLDASIRSEQLRLHTKSE